MDLRFPFRYYECLPSTTLDRLPEILKIGAGSTPEVVLIIRLLSGALEVEHINSGKKYLQHNNYFSSDFKAYKQYWDKRFPKLFSDNYTIDELGSYIHAVRFKNRKFYKNILSELSHYFLYEKKGVHSLSFVFLYRALEHLSYALPLIYGSRTQDFMGTFSYLKNLMKGDKSFGELGFFKKFIETVFAEDPIRESSVDFKIEVDTETEQQRIFSTLRELCKIEMIADPTDEPRTLSIKYTEVGSLIITIRNRFFHYMNGGEKNIDTSQVPDLDNFFHVINGKGLFWLTTILLAVLVNDASSSDRHRP